jgi:tetratricopeptide (TPR) repeat protein
MHQRLWPVFFGPLFAINFLRGCFNPKSLTVTRIFCILILLFFFSSTHAQHQLSQTKSEILYQKGSELVAHSNYGAARKVFSEFLQEAAPNDPRRTEAEYYVAFSSLSLTHNDGEKLIEDFISRNPSSLKAATAWFDLANFFYDDKSYSKATSYFKKVDYPALTLDQQNQAHFRAGYSYFNLKKLDEALEQFNLVKNVNSQYAPASNYYAGFIEYSNGQYEEALKDLRKAETNPSYTPVVPYLMANVLYKQKKYDELLQYVNSIKGKTGVQNMNEISLLAAEAHYFKADYKNAVDAYERYLADNPAKADGAVLFRAGFSNYQLNQTEKAVTYLSKSAAGKDSTSFYASYYLGILYLKQGQKPLAINAFDVARKYQKDPKLVEESSFQYAKVLYDAGRPDQAITEFEKFLKEFRSSSHSTEIRELLAQAYINGNNYHKAIEYIESLPTKSPQVEQAYQKAAYLKGVELFNKEDYAGAVVNFEKSLKYPRDPEFIIQSSLWAAEAYSMGRKFEAAIRHYKKVLESATKPDLETLLKTRYGLGYAHYNLEAYDNALLNFQDFVNRGNKSTPNYTDGLIRLADCYYVSKKYDEALSNYTKARNIGSPDNDYVLLQTGVISGIQRKYTESRAQLTSLIQSYAKSQYRDEALFQRAQFDIEQGNSQAAVDGLSQLIRESANSKFLPYAYMRRASSYFNLKQYEKSIADYGAVIKQFPTHPLAQEVLLPLQDALTAAGKSSEFDTYLSQFKKANPGNQALENIEFETGKNLYFDQQYQKAITSLNAFLASYPSSSRASETKYYIAESHYRLKDLTKAYPIYKDLGTDATFAFGSRVEGRLAEIEYKQGMYPDAVRSFKRLEKLATNKKEQSNAWMGLMESFYMQAQYDSADAYARIIIERGAVNASAQNKASLFLGKSAFARGDYETAKDEFLNTLNTAQDEFGAEAKYLLGQTFFLEKNYTQSYETLTSLNKDFGSYDSWVGKSFLLIADNFIAQENYFQAKATLQSLIDSFPSETVKEEARKKLQGVLEKEIEIENQQKADTVEKN